MFDFEKCFTQLTGNDPFDWQNRLFQKLLAGDFPDVCDIPTGLGKTSVMAIWLIALACQLEEKARTIPLRLAYVVDRRVIVDQATTEAENLLKILTEALSDKSSHLHSLAKTLRQRSMKGQESLIALSTLRGQKADNREWCLDPSRPAIIIGTVDMIGSRLLFSGYGKVGINHRSLQAGLLGQDTVVVIDEAHLSSVFVSILLDIKLAIHQTTLLRPFHVISLSATLSTTGKTLELDEQKELQNAEAKLRLNAKKQIEFLHFNQIARAKEGKKASPKEIDEELAQRLVNRAIQYESELEAKPARSIVIFVQTVNLVNLIAEKLRDKLEQLALQRTVEEFKDEKEQNILRQAIEARILKMTGEMRGYERDREHLVQSPKFQAFLPERDRQTPRPPQYLIATSSAEVGVNLDADDGLSDLSTLDSMIQRIGRINRFGKTESTISVIVDEQGLNALASDFKKMKSISKALLLLTAEIDQLQAQLAKPSAEKAAKKDIQKKITLKKTEKKNLEKSGVDYGMHNVEREEAKVYFTWKALKSREDENGKINASPLALRGLLTTNQEALPDIPVRPPFDEARVDDWAMTSLKQSEYPRPLVQYWLRGVVDDETAQTTLVWRIDLDYFDFAGISEIEIRKSLSQAVELATAIPIQPQERANIATFRAAALFKVLAEKSPDKPIVLIDPGGEAKAYALRQIKENKNLFALLAFSTAILPCSIGGLDNDGNPLDKLPKEPKSVKDVVGNEWTRYLVVRHSSDIYSIKQHDQSTDGERRFATWQGAIRSIKDKGVCDNAKEIQKVFADVNEEEKNAFSYIAFFFNQNAGSGEKKASLEADRFLREDVDDVASLGLQTRTVAEHDADVEKYARDLAQKIGMPDEVIELLAAAGFRHDLGKAREWWQNAIGNFNETAYAKSNVNSFDHGFNQGYRHEFGSLIESLGDEALKAHTHRDLILHLIAAHHGYARPHFPERAFDRNQTKPENQRIAHDVMLRFNRLQQQYGWWQLAYLEALLKAADAMASRDLSRGEL
ncbi:type I-U CRISPR-associated helicase/endonuclease Cas3 [bacterium]|nr:type I-U CRISPR-associated helicase/endonuclease Cas3 [bacterium]